MPVRPIRVFVPKTRIHTNYQPYLSQSFFLFRNFHLSDQNHKKTLRNPILYFEERNRKTSEEVCLSSQAK
ncbi:hypothetical protein D3H66_03845 [Citrobacter portucalensis]|uniref:Uncharacterized protein n=1 Tax=Citrobacter portucalensis TaxID=1639133 RepID=A0A5B0TAE2_9ENTR|nr:hypothetical protein D3H66_03845 [Citrobacter portucalensis]